MKTMKMNFKYVMMAAALSMGFAGCSNDNGDEVVPPVNANEHSVNVKINVGAATRADEAGTAIGQTPVLTDLTLFFVDNVIGNVNLVHSANVSAITTPTGENIVNLPGGSNAIYAIGNLSNVPSATIAAITSANTEDDLKAALIDVAAQLGAGTPSYEHVNLYGYTTYAVPIGGTSASASMDIYPAISRLEIAQIEADPAPSADKIVSYDLDGIFINNTYNGIGVDPAIYGSALAYPGSDLIWTTNIGSYPAAFCDYFSPAKTGSTTYNPATNRWAYFVAPAAKIVGGLYVGESFGGMDYDAKPVIVVKMSNLTYDPTYGGTPYDPAYITITKLKEGSVYLDHFERGNVYDIANIKFDASNLTGTPMTAPDHDVTVDVTVKPWTGVTTEPEF